jgi:type IV fimbrial biogenesis protein FimT
MIHGSTSIHTMSPGTGARPEHVAGFSLLELMVTLTVAGIVMAVAVPAFQGLSIGNRLTTQANEIVAAMNLARSEAIKRNATIVLCRAESDTATACADAPEAWENWILLAPSGVLRRGTINTFNDSIVLESTLTNDRASFSSDGLVRTGGALVNDNEFVLCSTGGHTDNIRRITLGAGSRPSTAMETGDCE